VNIRRIIVGVDASVPSRAAIRFAADEADATGAELVLAHVIDDEWGTISDRMAQEADTDTTHLLTHEKTHALEHHPRLAISTRTLTGSPMWELAKLSTPTTLLVVGTHKSGFHYGRAYGSRSLQLANLATNAVAVIPESAVRFRTGIIVGIDPTPAGWAALETAAEQANRRNTELTMIRACAPDPAPGRDDADRHLLAQAVDRVKTLCPHTTIRSRIVRRPAGIALNDLARTAELLIIGDSRRPGTQPGTLGSVAYDVLLNLTSPTMVIHTTDTQSKETEVVLDDRDTKDVNHANR
jgi:nucleotide-binding universal stress UspA family protein